MYYYALRWVHQGTVVQWFVDGYILLHLQYFCWHYALQFDRTDYHPETELLPRERLSPNTLPSDKLSIRQSYYGLRCTAELFTCMIKIEGWKFIQCTKNIHSLANICPGVKIRRYFCNAVTFHEKNHHKYQVSVQVFQIMLPPLVARRKAFVLFLWKEIIQNNGLI